MAALFIAAPGGATDSPRPASLRALIVAAIIGVAGAVIGVAGFAYQQAHADWRPHVTTTSAGRHVTQPYLGIDEPSLAGDHIAWQAGPYTIVMDLRSGKTRLVGDAHDAQSLAPPDVSARIAVWAEYSSGSHGTNLIYAYDFSSGRRQRLLETHADLVAAPVATGETAVWLSGTGSAATVVACDVATGRRRVLARGSHLGPFLFADGPYVAWSHQTTPTAPFSLVVIDTTTDTVGGLALPDQSGATFDAPILAKKTLLWQRSAGQNGTVNTYDLRTLAGRVIASGPLVGSPGFDGTTVVWVQRSADGAAYEIMGRRLSGGAAFRVARVTQNVQSVLVSGDTVAWWAGSGQHSWLQTARLPQ
jgi:hypothetical protein